MKYSGMPMGMWMLFNRSFKDNLVTVLGYSKEEADKISRLAASKYKQIIARLPEFEKKDRFKMNIVNCAMLCAFLLNMENKPDVQKLSEYYEKAMMIPAMKWFCQMAGKSKFSNKDIRGMKETAELKAADRNPYSWNMELLPYEDGSGYEARFSKCGICTLMKEYDLYDMVPAMCHLDYSMSEAGGASEFVREYTLASGGPYCDCGYRKKK